MRGWRLNEYYIESSFILGGETLLFSFFSLRIYLCTYSEYVGIYTIVTSEARFQT